MLSQSNLGKIELTSMRTAMILSDITKESV